ncbi:MAG TPA: peroxidase [Actinomycetota bacterium]
MDEAEADALVHGVARDWRSAPLSEADRALCAFAAKLTHDQQRMAAADLDRLRDHGFDDRAIHDAVQVIAYFNYVTRVADALGVEDEDFIPPWGSPE